MEWDSQHHGDCENISHPLATANSTSSITYSIQAKTIHRVKRRAARMLDQMTAENSWSFWKQGPL
jgi:hypothetical protein